jgi:oligosaccharide repeat unit polymerase
MIACIALSAGAQGANAALNIGCCLILAALALWQVKLSRGWTKLGPAMPLFWLFAGGLPVIYWGVDQVPAIGLALITLFVGSYCLGYAVPLAPRATKSRYALDCNALLRAVVPLALIGALAIPLHLKLAPGLTGSGVQALAREISLQRYEAGVVAPAVVRLTFPAFYAAAALGGVLCASSLASRPRIIGALAVVPAFAYGALTTTKAAAIWSFLLWFGGWLVAQVALVRPLNRLRVRSLFAMTVGLAATIAAAFFLRYDLRSLDQWAAIADKFLVYALAHQYNFSVWASEMRFPLPDLHLGAVSFGGVLSTFFGAGRVQGVYADFAQNGAQSIGNIYTAFRGLIEDFGVVGAGLLMAAVGSTARYLTEGYRIRGLAPVTATLGIALYLWIGFSFAVNALYYTTINASLLVVFLALVFSTSRVPGAGR